MATRRNFVTAGIAALVGLVTGKTHAAIPPEAKRTTIEPHPFVQDIPSDIPEHIKDDRFLVVVGGVVPGLTDFPTKGADGSTMHPPHIRRVPRHEVCGSGSDGGDLGAWYEILPDMDMQDDKAYPRAKQFRMTGDLRLGTIDQLANEFRKNLIQACTMWAESTKIYPNGEYAKAQEAYKDMEPGLVFFDRTGDQNHRAYLDRREEMFPQRLRVGRQVPKSTTLAQRWGVVDK
jgi:hypothetical protein